MKHPNGMSNEDSSEKGPVTPEQVMAAQSRAIRAQQEAIDLRNKLEGLESLLAQTKKTLAAANVRMVEKDREIAKVQNQARTLGGSVAGLEQRFQKLRLLQEELAVKRKELGLDKPERSENSEDTAVTDNVKEESVPESNSSTELKAEVIETVETSVEKSEKNEETAETNVEKSEKNEEKSEASSSQDN